MLVLIQYESCPHSKRKFRHAKKHQGCSHTEVRQREDTGRKWSSASQGEWSQGKKKQKTTLPTPCYWNLASEIMRKYVTVTCVSQWYLLWQPWETHTTICAEKWGNLTNAGAYH